MLLLKKITIQLFKMTKYLKTNTGPIIDTKIDTCVESLVKRHLIVPIAKIVDDYTKNYKFKGKSIEKIDLPYTVRCDENKKYDHATNILLNIAAIDDEIFILNNCFNISVYNHINKQITREFELDLPCDTFHHRSVIRESVTLVDVMEKLRVWEFLYDGMKIEIKKVKMFISKLNNEILLYFLPCNIIFVFNSLNGNFVRKFEICCWSYDDVTFDGKHLYAIGSHSNGIVHVSIINILDGSIIREWANGKNGKTYNLSRIRASIINKNTMYIVGRPDEYSYDEMIYACDVDNGENMRKLKTIGLIYGLMVYDDYVYTYDCGFNNIFNVFDIAEDNNEKIFSESFVSGLDDYKIVLHYGKMFLIKKKVCLKDRTRLENSIEFNAMLKSNPTDLNVISKSNALFENVNTDYIASNDAINSCLDVDSNNRIKISLYIIY